MERRRILPRAALRRAARRFALLPGISLSKLHENDPRRPAGDPRLSRDANAVSQQPATAGTALAAELPRRHARLEFPVLPARRIRAEPAEEHGMESWRVSGHGRGAFRRLPPPQEPLLRRKKRRGPSPRAGGSAVCAC